MSKIAERAEVEIGETHVVIKRENSSVRQVVEILYKTNAKEGTDAIYIVLKSLAHKKGETHFGRYAISGCVVTEMLLEPYRTVTVREINGRMDMLFSLQPASN